MQMWCVLEKAVALEVVCEVVLHKTFILFTGK